MHLQTLSQSLKRWRADQRQICWQYQPAVGLRSRFDGGRNAVAHAFVRPTLQMPRQARGFDGCQSGLKHRQITQLGFKFMSAATGSQKTLTSARSQNQYAGLIVSLSVCR